jgi:pimeloyl-ACP methyl ester carboxylesterase
VRRRLASGAALVAGVVLVFTLWPRHLADEVGSWMAGAGVVPQHVTVDGLSLRYVRLGQGPPVVLLHGIASSIYTWKDVLPALGAHHDVIAVDLPGFGGSAVPKEASGERAVRSVIGVMDALGLRRASLVGNSLGGAISVAVAAHAPERVDSLVLIDPAGYNFAAADRPFVLRLAAGVPTVLADALPLRPLVSLSLRQVFHDDTLVTPDRVAEYVAPLRRPGAAAHLRGLLLATEGLGFPGVVRAVRAPTLILWGRYDTWIPVGDASRFAADIPGSRVVLLEAGHMPQEERPAETAALIAGFLAEGPK